MRLLPSSWLHLLRWSWREHETLCWRDDWHPQRKTLLLQAYPAAGAASQCSPEAQSKHFSFSFWHRHEKNTQQENTLPAPCFCRSASMNYTGYHYGYSSWIRLQWQKRVSVSVRQRHTEKSDTHPSGSLKTFWKVDVKVKASHLHVHFCVLFRGDKWEAVIIKL